MPNQEVEGAVIALDVTDAVTRVEADWLQRFAEGVATGRSGGLVPVPPRIKGILIDIENANQRALFPAFDPAESAVAMARAIKDTLKPPGDEWRQDGE